MTKLSELTLFDMQMYENVEAAIKSNVYQSYVSNEKLWKNIFSVFRIENEFVTFLTENKEFDYSEFAIDCFLTFCQANFTGPDLPPPLKEFLESDLFKDDFSKLLTVNSEEINCCTKYPVLLYVAKCVFKYSNLDVRWQIRTVMVHQKILDETCHDLLNQIAWIEECVADGESDGSLVERHIEMANLYQIFRNIPMSKSHLDQANKLLDFKFKLIGKMGRRTKHQQESVSQLALEVEMGNEACHVKVPILEVTHNSELNDDVRLDSVQFDEGDQLCRDISDLEQKFLIAFVNHTLISRPQENLYMEEIRPILDTLLSQNNCWALRNVVLSIRSKLEFGNSHTNERSLSQFEGIINGFTNDTPCALYRMMGMFSVSLQPIWKVEAEGASILLKMGLVKASLELFLRLQLWEEVVVCYNLLQLRGRAAEVIKEQLRKNPTVKLWCLLGDATDDESCYEKAWELSNKTSSRAQRHWGNYHYFRKNYEQSMAHFKISTDIHCLQETILLRYGFAALETENWQTAVKIYKLYTSLEMENFQVWNNLAKAQIKLNNLDAAHKALKEAVKCNYENWKVWDNLLAVSSDLKNFDDVILAYNRILDINREYMCVEVLSALIQYLFGKEELEKDIFEKLFKKTCTLFGRIQTITPKSGQIMELYAQLAPNMKVKMDRLLRALNNYTAVERWYSETEPIDKIVDVSVELAESALSEEIDPKDPALISINRSLNSVISLIKKHVYIDATHWLDRINDILNQVRTKMGLTS